MKYAAVARIAVRQQLSARGEAIARVFFYLAILLVFSRLWGAMAEDGAVAGFDAVALVWYLALTEWVTLATPMVYLAIQEDVRRGDIAYRIARPVHYLWLKLSEGLGEAVVRLSWLAAAGVGLAWLLTGGLPADPRGLLLALPLGILSVAVLLLFQLAIGLSTFWTQDASPTYWIWQKLCFVLGGLLFPLEIYPDWLRAIALWTPFQPLIHGVGRAAFAYDPALAAETALKIVAWGAVLAVFTAWLYRRGLRILNVNGG